MRYDKHLCFILFLLLLTSIPTTFAAEEDSTVIEGVTVEWLVDPDPSYDPDWPQPVPPPFDGINHFDDKYDIVIFGGVDDTLRAWGPWIPDEDADVTRIELITWNNYNISLGIWSDNGTVPSGPLNSLAYTEYFNTSSEWFWQGRDLPSPLQVYGGTKYWIVLHAVVAGTRGGAVWHAHPPYVNTTNFLSTTGDITGGATWEPDLPIIGNFGIKIRLFGEIPPVADADGPYIDFEGSPVTLNGSESSDYNGVIVSYEWDLDNDGSYDEADGVTPTYTWGDDYNGPIGLKVTDDDGLHNTSTTTATIINVAPTVYAEAVMPLEIGYREATVNFIGEFTDPGWLDTHTATWDFGDGTPPVPAPIDEENEEPDATGSVVGSHTYGRPGTFHIILTVMDDDGGVGTYEFSISFEAVGGEMQPDGVNIPWWSLLIATTVAFIAITSIKHLRKYSSLF